MVPRQLHFTTGGLSPVSTTGRHQLDPEQRPRASQLGHLRGTSLSAGYRGIQKVPSAKWPLLPSRSGAALSTRRHDLLVVLSGEQLRAGTEWVESGRLRLRRRTVTEARTVEVVVRREELIIETRDTAPGAVGESYRGVALDGPLAFGSPPTSMVMQLREEVPEVVLRPRVYERVTADVVTVSEVAV